MHMLSESSSPLFSRQNNIRIELNLVSGHSTAIYWSITLVLQRQKRRETEKLVQK